VPSIPVTPAAVDAADVGVEVDDDDDDALLQAALAMSMAEAAGEEAGDAPAGAVAETPAAAGGAGGSSFVTPSAGEAFLDPAFVNSLLAGLPGVDMNDPKIQEAMQQVTTGGADGKEDEGEKDKDAKDKKDGGN
jgi:26S proteasome regulatory subunit N10